MNSLEAKTFEIRDRGTFIPALAINLAVSPTPEREADRYLLGRSGYQPLSGPHILLGRLEGGMFHVDPWDHNSNTWRIAHKYILSHWDELESGAVICCETIRGERTKPKVSERLEGRSL